MTDQHSLPKDNSMYPSIYTNIQKLERKVANGKANHARKIIPPSTLLTWQSNEE